jgi:hypothetical protein
MKIKIYVKNERNIFHAVNKTREAAVKASYALSRLIASHSILLQECLIEIAKIVFHEKVKD